MKLIVESGSTKTDWVIINTPDTYTFQTTGINPLFFSESDTIQEIHNSFPNTYKTEHIREIHFYGAGCGTNAAKQKIKDLLSPLFPQASIYIYTDLVASAHALLQNKKGIVAILGTGTNVGFWDGTHIEYSSPSLGYILGDEGSGTYLGKKLLQAYFYESLPHHLLKKFADTYTITRESCIHAIYSGKKPNTYIASFVPFLHTHKHEASIQSIIHEGFRDFIEKHILKISQKYNFFSIFVTGSIGFHFNEILKTECAKYSIRVEQTIKSPISELIKLYSL
ncbi:MAG: N-acetylglucosamine kinase [Bacteroidota bacterium]